MAFRKNILMLATKISIECGTYMGVTPSDPEYMILDPIVTDEMAEVGMHVKVRSPRPIELIAKKCGRTVEDTQRVIDQLAGAGIVRCVYEGDKETYYYPIWVPGIMEGILSVKEQCEKHTPCSPSASSATRATARPSSCPTSRSGMGPMRVMPVGSAIKNDTHAAPYDEVERIIDNAWAVSVGPCSCRRTRRLMGEGCGHLEEDMCMYINDNAKLFSEQGRHRLVSKEEAKEILKRAEDNGLVHEINAAEGIRRADGNLQLLRLLLPRAPASASTSTTRTCCARTMSRAWTRTKCVACGQCVENCQLGALKLGAKLCGHTDTEPEERPDPFGHALDQEAVQRRLPHQPPPRCSTAAPRPCKMECPAHIPVQGYIKLASQGRYLEALELIKQENPFPAVCGRICNAPAARTPAPAANVDSSPSPSTTSRSSSPTRELARRDALCPADAQPDRQALHQQDRRHRRRAGRPELRLLPRRQGLSRSPCSRRRDRVGGMLTRVIPAFRLEKDVVEAEIDVLQRRSAWSSAAAST